MYMYCLSQPSNYLSDIGGVLGLWVGFSMLTITEFVELAMDLIMLKLGSLCRKPGTGPTGPRAPAAGAQITPPGPYKVTSFHMQEQDKDKTDFPPVEKNSDTEGKPPDSAAGKRKKPLRKVPRSSGLTRKKVAPSSDYGSDTDSRSRTYSGRSDFEEGNNVNEFSPDDYIPLPSGGTNTPPPPYSSREVSSDSMNVDTEGRHTSRDIHLHLS